MKRAPRHALRPGSAGFLLGSSSRCQAAKSRAEAPSQATSSSWVRRGSASLVPGRPTRMLLAATMPRKRNRYRCSSELVHGKAEPNRLGEVA